MIKVNVLKEENTIKEIQILGHAMYDDFGKDIVCSAVSSIVITTINGLLAIDDESILYEEKKDELDIIIKKENDIVNKLIRNMLDLLKSLHEQYPKNIIVKGD
ncbi:MAG: ribosomal-processing cysteine protease Prp [Bacilli bacterium]|nr:ribosomal-processing cysteine protease Prp [Bacilli bacterium]